MPANTATFEQELTSAIRNGCPSCGSEFYRMEYTTRSYKYPQIDQDDNLSYLDAMGTDTEPPELELIACEACEFPIWSDGDWAPELYKEGI
jgi:hypothetical protein